jgi:hypothetical protein
VRVHSAFIAELLNPQGSHGQGNIFLKLFKEQFAADSKLDYLNAKVEIEKHIGNKKENEDYSGRIDIFIKDEANNCIVIENKIYAGDQENQLVRYHKYCEKYHNGKFNILYLTLDGKEASEKSTNGLTSIDLSQMMAKEEKKYDYLKISYKDNILTWLKECRKEAVIHPILREGITHYINLIKQLTNQTTNKGMADDIKKLLINSPENLMAGSEIVKEIENAKLELKERFRDNLLKKLKTKGIKAETRNDLRKRYNQHTIDEKIDKNLKFDCSIDVELGKVADYLFVWSIDIQDELYSIVYARDIEKKGYGWCLPQKDKCENLIKIAQSCKYENAGQSYLAKKKVGTFNFKNFNSDASKLLFNAEYQEEIIQRIVVDAYDIISAIKNEIG